MQININVIRSIHRDGFCVELIIYCETLLCQVKVSCDKNISFVVSNPLVLKYDYYV